MTQGFAQTGDATPSGLQRYEAPLHHFGADGELLAELGMFSGNETFFVAFDRGFSVFEGIFPLFTYRVAVGDGLYIAANDTYEIRRLTPDGELTGIIRRAHEPVAVTDEHVRAERERQVAEAPSDASRDRLDEVWGDIPIPETFPAYHLVRADDDFNLWVQEYPIPGITEAVWMVYDRDGFVIAEVSAPTSLDPLHIGADFVLGRWTDDLGVEHVTLYGVERPSIGLHPPFTPPGRRSG